MKKLIAIILLTAIFTGASLSAVCAADDKAEELAVIDKNENYEARVYKNDIDRNTFMAEFNSKRGRPHLFLSDESGHEGNIAAKHYEGRDSLFFKTKSQYAYGKVPETITKETKNAAVKVTFFDRDADYVRYTYTMTNGSGKNVLICKNGTNKWQTETILLDNSKFEGVMKYGSDFYLNTYDGGVKDGNEYICDVEFINLDTEAASVTVDGKKKHVIQQGTLPLMSKMGFFEETLDLSQKADMQKAAEVFKAITGKEVSLNQDATLREVIEAFSTVLGLKCEKESDYISNKIVRNLTKHPQQWFGTNSYKTQTHGLYDIAVGTYDRAVFNDDLVGLCYNLLYLKENGETYLAKLCENEEFFLNMASTYDRNLVYSYYYEKGFRIRENVRIEKTTGETITEFYCPGTNVNIPYINELTTVDNENIVLMAGVDKQYDTGYPVVYNRKTGKTITVDMHASRKYCQVLSEKNILYYTSGSKIYSYNINTREKKVLWEEPGGYELQEIPTITRDGRYMCVFWGTEISYAPNHIGILDTETGEMKTYLNQKWVDDNLYGPDPCFVGHVIINPMDPTIVQFLHGGGNHVEDRMWFLDTKTGKTWIAPEMSRKFNGDFAEHCVHWVWSFDGKKVYYCRMTTLLGAPTGVVCYDFENNPDDEVVLVDDSYAFAHAVPSCDDTLIVGDTHRTSTDGSYKGDVALYDKVSGFSRLLAYNNCWQNHPCHSHPVFSVDGTTVFYNTSDEATGFIRAASINITSTVEDMRKNGDVRHYETVKVSFGKENIQEGIRVSNDSENNYPEYAKVNGEECRAIEYGMSLYADTDGEYIRTTDNRILLRLTYFDNGTEPFIMNYNTNKPSEDSRLKNFKSISIPRQGTNKWVTRDIYLEDASFRSAISTYDFSFNISSAESPVCYIKEIEATALR